MSRFLLCIVFLALAAPAYAKPIPASCDELWGSVTEALGNPNNYTVIATDGERMRASFVVVGSVYRVTNVVFLKEKKNGCELGFRMGFTGNDDEGALRSRVKRAMVKRRKAAAALTITPSIAATKE